MHRFYLALVCAVVSGFALSACDSRIDDDIEIPQTTEDNPAFFGCTPTVINASALPFTITREVPESETDSTVADVLGCDNVRLARLDSVVTPADTTEDGQITPADTSLVKATFEGPGDYYRINLPSARTVTVTVDGDSTFLPYVSILPARGDSIVAFEAYELYDAAATDSEPISVSAQLNGFGMSNSLSYIIGVGYLADSTAAPGATYTLVVE